MAKEKADDSSAIQTETMASVPAVITAADSNARFAYEEFFFGEISNNHTRLAYRHSVHKFLQWVDDLGADLKAISPKMVRVYLDRLRVDEGTQQERPASIATQKLHLAALRHFFDVCVTRHAVMLNPAASVRGKKYATVEGKTPEISVKEARKLLASIDKNSVIGLRDRAAIGVMIYTAARVGAVASLKVGDFYHNAGQWFLRFSEKGGKSREIPVRHDLQAMILDYWQQAAIKPDAEYEPLFRSAPGKRGLISEKPITGNDLCRIVKRRMRKAGLTSRLSAHSFRVCTITDLLEQDVPLADVQHLVGHADPRTTKLYDRRRRKITRNIVERISV